MTLDCIICARPIQRHCQQLKCTLCKQWCHLNCIPLFNNNDFNYANDNANNWYCNICNSTLFPFNGNDDEDFYDIIINLNTNELDVINKPNNINAFKNKTVKLWRFNNHDSY